MPIPPLAIRCTCNHRERITPFYCFRAGQQVDLIMLGPLTNLALALRLYPRLCDALGCVYIMGGATEAIG